MTDKTVDQMVEDATRALEAVVDESWIPWMAHLVPNVARRVRAEAEARAWEEHDWKLQEEAKCCVDEKLTAVLEGWLTQAELEVNSEVDEMGEAEESEAVETEEVGMTGGTQSSVMEVNEEGEDEVVVVEEAK